MNPAETIAALATAPAPAGIAVIRISGPKCLEILRSVFSSKLSPAENPRTLVFGSIKDSSTGEEIERALSVFMPQPESYTGEDVVELQIHGSPVLVKKILGSVYAAGARPAEPGEFTKRAFLNGKLDLAQAEAVNDLISSTSDRALKIANEHLKGRFSSAVLKLGGPLREILAEIEATVDFPEEEVPAEDLKKISETVTQAAGLIYDYIDSYRYGSAVKDGFRVLLCGPPNSGKSSLLNRLLDKKRALVTEISGTTRDLIEDEADYNGYRFIFCDSAGIAETKDKVELLGIELAWERVGWADLVLLVVDSSENAGALNWRDILKRLSEKTSDIWLIASKADLPRGDFFPERLDAVKQTFILSSKTGEGVSKLREALISEVESRLPQNSDASGIVTSQRQRNSLLEAKESLERVLEALGNGLPVEFAAAELRSALSALDEIIGITWNEDILERIFSRFCIGK